jgi:hypothetical protein
MLPSSVASAYGTAERFSKVHLLASINLVKNIALIEAEYLPSELENVYKMC